MQELKAAEKKESEVEIAYMAVVESVDALSPRLLPSADLFAFDFSFSILPDIISNNTPVPFL